MNAGRDQLVDVGLVDAADREDRYANGFRQARDRGRADDALFGLDGPTFVDGVAAHIEYPPHHSLSDGHGNGRAGVDDFVAAFETFGGGHGDGPHPVITKVLLHFEGQFELLVLDSKFDSQRVVDGRQFFRKFDIHDRTYDLNNLACIHVALFH